MVHRFLLLNHAHRRQLWEYSSQLLDCQSILSTANDFKGSSKELAARCCDCFVLQTSECISLKIDLRVLKLDPSLTPALKKNQTSTFLTQFVKFTLMYMIVSKFVRPEEFDETALLDIPFAENSASWKAGWAATGTKGSDTRGMNSVCQDNLKRLLQRLLQSWGDWDEV